MHRRNRNSEELVEAHARASPRRLPRARRDRPPSVAASPTACFAVFGMFVNLQIEEPPSPDDTISRTISGPLAMNACSPL